MRPTISTASADSTRVNALSAMVDVHDNTAVDVDFHEVASRFSVGAAAGELAGTSSPLRERGGLKQIWDGFLDDLLGPGKADRS